MSCAYTATASVTVVRERHWAVGWVEWIAIHQDDTETLARASAIAERLARGESVALVSDAGTPLISDPCFKLVREVSAAGHAVYALPGQGAQCAATGPAHHRGRTGGDPQAG